MSNASASHSEQALTELAAAFTTQAQILNMAITAAEAVIDIGMEFAWGPAGNMTRALYLVPAAEASGAINGICAALENTAAALSGLAQTYNASEAQTAGMFDQIG